MTSNELDSSSEDLFDAESLETVGWGQCVCLPDELVTKLQRDELLPTLDSGGSWVVLTQSCDLLNKSLGEEPRVEVILAEHRSKKLNQGKKHGNDARELHLRDATSEQKLGFHSKNRHCFPRELLMGFRPDAVIGDKETRRELVRWISRKYERAAFADAFNRRWFGIRKEWSKAVEKSDGDLYAIYVDVSSEELVGDTPYRINVYCVASMEATEDDRIFHATDALAETFGQLMDACNGIEVQECHLVTMAELSLEDIHRLQRFDFDAITIKGDGVDAAPRDG